MKKLKIVSKGWQGYTGYLGITEFKDGVSVDPVPRHIADRMTGIAMFEEINEDGENVQAGIAHRLVAESAARIPVQAPLQRQSMAERIEEERLDALRNEKPPVQRFYKSGELQKIADEKGMKGLRVIGDSWGVKARSIPNIIGEILRAQSGYLEKRNKKLEQLSERARQAAEEAEIDRELRAEKERKEQAEIDRLASTLAGHDDLAPVYTVDDKVIPDAVIIDGAWRTSAKTVTGWNALDPNKRWEFIAGELARLADVYGAKLKPIEKIEEPQSEPDDILVGSNHFANSYDIGNETVSLGDLVCGAFERFEGTVDAWNALEEDARDDLIRLELDQRLAAAG